MKSTTQKSKALAFLLITILQLGCENIIQAQDATQFVKSELFADSLILLLPLEDKVKLLHGMGGGNSLFGDLDVRFFGIKGNDKYGIPPFYMGHGITGVRSGRDTSIHATYFCTPIAMGCSWDQNLYAKVGTAIAKEMRALGQDLNLGPTLNIIRHPLGGRNWESFSEDPFLTAQLAVPYVKAMQAQGIVCGPKHFVANNQEHNRLDINNEVDERTLREIYLPAFKAAIIQGGALNVMGAYNRVNGSYMCHNKYLLDDILRKEWGFKGFVLSDFANGIRNTTEPINARMNLEMHRPKYYSEKLLEAVRNGSIQESQVDALLKDILIVMHQMNIFNRDRFQNERVIHSSEHIKLALKVAQESPVLLKNEDAILPLNTSQLQTVAVIGPNAKRFTDLPFRHANYAYYLQGGGSGRTYYFQNAVIEPYVGIVESLDKNTRISYAQGCQSPYFYRDNQESMLDSTEVALIEEAVSKAKEAEVAIIFAGLSGFNESEGRDRSSTNLPGQQNKLIKEIAKVNPNTIVVAIAGSYVNVEPWIDDVKALLYVPYCGEQVGQGIADMLTGNVNPSGRLPFTWVKNITDYPSSALFTGGLYSEDSISNIYEEGIFVGYRYFDQRDIKVRFPFGYGLSYTQFKYSDLEVDESAFPIRVKVSVSNIGDRPGAEVIQLYITAKNSRIERAKKELKAFQKVNLAPGESKNVEIQLDKNAFAYYDVSQQGWVIEQGRYEIRLGGNSRHLPLKKEVQFNQEKFK